MNSGTVLSVVKDSIDVNFGDVTSGRIGNVLSLKYYNPYTNIGILRTPRDFLRETWAAVTLITKIKDRKCAIRVIHVSGTIKQAQLFLIDYNKKKLLELKHSLGDSKTRKLLVKSDKDINALEA
jgi:ribonuclease P/MRP protein subunit POP5